jgi:hypothetical protein
VTDWDNVEPGDADPTDSGTPDELLCPWIYENGHEEFFCTRVSDHDGPHVAGDGDEVLAVWS